MAGSPILEFRGISKEYAGNPVLKGVDLAVEAGEIHALVGENGAGKSTLMNILFGMPVIQDTGGYTGEVRLAGQAISFRSPEQSMASGIGMVHQEFMLLPGFSAAENIKLHREPVRPNLLSRLLTPGLATLDRGRMTSDARAALARAGLDIDVWAPIAGLPVSHLQFIEIARELDKENMRVLVFDEPTAVLTEGEATTLLGLMRDLAARGIAILFITHRLHEVLEVARRITVLRDGEVVARLARDQATLAGLAELMVGRKLEQRPRGTSTAGTAGREPALALRRFSVAMPGEEVRDLELDVRAGEILGLGGISGYGKVGVANGLMGLAPAHGDARKDGQPLRLNDPAAALRARLAFVSEDRRGTGLMLDESIELNIVLPAIRIQRRFLRGAAYPGPRLLDRDAIRKHAERMIADLDIRCTGPAQAVRRLSGGNQQKVCVARAMTLDPEILLVSEPTRGIDVGAKKRVLDLISELNETRQMTVLMTSSDLGELRTACHRIAIITHGHVHAMLPPDASDASFGLAMAGETVPAA